MGIQEDKQSQGEHKTENHKTGHRSDTWWIGVSYNYNLLLACGLLVDYCDVFISYLDSHSDGTHSLQRSNWCALFGWAEGEQLFSKFSFLGEQFL